MIRHITYGPVDLSDEALLLDMLEAGYHTLFNGDEWLWYKDAKCICHNKLIGFYNRQPIYLSQWGIP